MPLYVPPAKHRKSLKHKGFYSFQCIKVHLLGGTFLPRAVILRFLSFIINNVYNTKNRAERLLNLSAFNLV